jgi:RNase P protein component
MPESEILSRHLYDAKVVATNKMTGGVFFPLVQKNAAKPIVLRNLIRRLIRIYRPPTSKKDPNMVIRVRTRDALTRLGYLQRVRQ